MNVFEKMFGTHSERELKRITSIVDKIESLRSDMQALSDEELRGKTKEYKNRLQEGATLDDLLPEAFATVREAAKRVLGMEHYRVQLIGGIILHQGRIAEMRTGEGKTLVSTLPAYLNALEGKGVHVVTVNDYLAHRDAEWMGKVHEFLGLTVGVVLNDMKNDERRAQYACDITYVWPFRNRLQQHHQHRTVKKRHRRGDGIGAAKLHCQSQYLRQYCFKYHQSQRSSKIPEAGNGCKAGT